MNKKIGLLCLGFLILGACHKDSPSKKIVDGLPVSTTPLAIVPAQAVQQYLLLKNSGLGPTIMNLNRLSQNFPLTGLSGPDGSLNYTYHVSESHFGSATFTIQFRDVGNGAVDPFSNSSSTQVIKFVHMAVAGTSGSFTYSEDLTLTLETVGLLTGPYTMTGTSNFNGSSYSIVFNITTPIAATISGLLNGPGTSVGTGPNSQPTSSSFIFGLSSDLNGSLTWEGETAGIHIASNGSGYLTTQDSRILFQ